MELIKESDINRAKRNAASKIVYKRAYHSKANLEQSFHAFVKSAWGVIEPSSFVDGWHIQAICKHLEAVTQGYIEQLLINCPPRHTKSLLVSVFWPAWEWTTKPTHQYLAATYSQSLTVRDSLKMRRLITSHWYQDKWPHVELRSDQWAKTYFENNSGGNRKSVSVGSQVTGFGGTRKIIDDPHNALEVKRSDTKRQEVIDWYKLALSSRDNDPKNVVTVMIMQRLHEEDLSGHILEKENWDTLILPAEFEGQRRSNNYFVRNNISLNYYHGWLWDKDYKETKGKPIDPRTEEGELLWPERFDSEALEKLKFKLGPGAVPGQLQQRPSSKGGNEFLQEWWDNKNRYDPNNKKISNKVIARWLSFDTAMKDKTTSDFNAMTVWELWEDYKILMRRAWHERLNFPELINKMETFAYQYNKDRKLHGIIIEDRQSGTSAIQTLTNRLPPEVADLLIAFNPTQSKEYRAKQASVWCERGCVLLPTHGQGTFELENELYKFPNAKNDDLLDTLTQAVIYLENYLSTGYQIRHGYVSVEEEPEKYGVGQDAKLKSII